MSAVLEESPEIMTAESGTVALLNKSEIDQQIATAHKYPRSIKRFMGEAEQLVTLSEEVAEECVYALPRKEMNKDTGRWETKTLEGPSARFAEIIFSCWGNARAGARVISDVGDFVTAQGVMHDLERNVAITYEVQRRIIDSKGKRYKPDMIGVTANAGSSIALRNAILKVIPKALWSPLYNKARQTIMGTAETLSNRRLAALANFQKRGVSGETIFEHFGVAGVEEITLEHLATMRGYLTAIKEGDTTVEVLFNKDDPAATGKSPPAGVAKPPYDLELFKKNLPGWQKTIAEGKKTPDQIITMLESKGALSDEQKVALRGGESTPIDHAASKNAGAAPALIEALREKAKLMTITDVEICKHLQVEALEGLTVAQVEQAMKFLANPL
jgi:hypothetical protein